MKDNMLPNYGYIVSIEGIRNRNIAHKFIGNHCFAHIISRNSLLGQIEVTIEDGLKGEYWTDISFIREENVEVVLKILKRIGFIGEAKVFYENKSHDDFRFLRSVSL